MIDVKILTSALVELEEEKMTQAGFWDCMADACDHKDGECPDPPGIGCGDADRLAQLYTEANDVAQLQQPDPA